MKENRKFLGIQRNSSVRVAIVDEAANLSVLSRLPAITPKDVAASTASALDELDSDVITSSQSGWRDPRIKYFLENLIEIPVFGLVLPIVLSRKALGELGGDPDGYQEALRVLGGEE